MADTLGPELVVNGTFDNASTAGWTPASGATLSAPNNALRVANSDPNKGTALSTPITFPAGTFVFKTQAFAGTAGAFTIQVGDGGSNESIDIFGSADTNYDQEFTVATGYDGGVFLITESADVGAYAEFDNVSIRQILQRDLVRTGGAFPAERFPRRVRVGSKTYVARDKRELDQIIRRHMAEGDI